MKLFEKLSKQLCIHLNSLYDRWISDTGIFKTDPYAYKTVAWAYIQFISTYRCVTIRIWRYCQCTFVLARLISDLCLVRFIFSTTKLLTSASFSCRMISLSISSGSGPLLKQKPQSRRQCSDGQGQKGKQSTGVSFSIISFNNIQTSHLQSCTQKSFCS